MLNRIAYIFDKYGFDGKEEPQSAPRVEDLKELVMLIYSDRSKWPELYKFCDELDYCLFHNEACFALLDRLEKQEAPNE